VSQTSRHARGTRHSFGGEQLEPLSLRLLRVAGVLSLLLILVVLNSLLNSGSESPFNPNPVAAAAERTAETPGMRFDMVMRVQVNGSPTGTITGKGAYDSETHLAGITYQAESSAGKRTQFDAVLGEDGWYYRYPQYTSKMPPGKEWIKVQGLPGQSDASKMSESPESSLQVLTAAGSVQRAGQVRIRKVQTTRYRATLTAEGVVQSLRSQGKDELADQFESVTLTEPVHAEVFIDRNGMLRRFRTVTTVFNDGKALTIDVKTDLFDLGIRPDIQLPPESRVYDITPQLEEKMDQLGQAS
jgi:hypothetical protein